MTDATFDRCAELLAGACTTAEFERWLYSTNDDDWGEDCDLYLELLEFDYRTRFADGAVRARLADVLEARSPGELGRRTAERIALELVAGRVDLIAGCRELCRLHQDGVAEVDVEWVSFDSELDEPEAVEWYGEHIVVRAQALLARLAERRA